MATSSEACRKNEINLKFGTKEWAESNVNCITGCSRNCKYCYAKGMAIRFKQKTPSNWSIMSIRKNSISKNYRKRKGKIMFPTSHDIVPEEPFKSACMTVLEKLLKAKNEVLITTKPSFKVVREICEKFEGYKDQIIFRFTIGAIDNEILKFWEPNAPSYEERFKSLKFAFKMGYTTSVSIEPFLEQNPIPLVQKLEFYVNDTIWIGLMNHIPRKNIPKKDEDWFNKIRKNNTFGNIMKFYPILDLNPKIRWKESIKKLVIKMN